MAELLNRETQRAVLQHLYACYPLSELGHRLSAIAEPNALAVNVFYLVEHGLVTAHTNTYGGVASVANAKITAQGIDFLADDGGLSAILGVTVVKLHSDTIRDLLIARVQASDEPMTVKERLIDQLKTTPALALGQLVQRALDAGLDAMPNAVDWLRLNL